MPAYDPQLRPVALSDQVVKFQPEDELRRVRAVEPMAQVGPLDFGAATSGGNATDDNGNDEIEITELEMNQNQFGQFRIEPISAVEIEFRQTGRQEQRMTNANTISQWTPNTPSNLREFFVLTDEVPYLVVNNPNQYDMDATRVKFHGFKYNLELGELDEDQVRQQPISLPVDRLEQSIQTQPGAQRPLQNQAPQGRGR